MSFLSELQKQKNKLKETETLVTRVDGQRYVEKDSTVTAVCPSTYGFVVDTKPDNTPVLISEYVYIGSQDCTASNILEAYNIKHVLSLGINVEVPVSNNKFVNCLDLPETNIKEILLDCLPFIRGAVDLNENVLIHCNAGVSRTSMIAIAYLMHYKSMQFQGAYDLVKGRRPSVRPNDGFMKQLKALRPGEVI